MCKMYIFKTRLMYESCNNFEDCDRRTDAYTRQYCLSTCNWGGCGDTQTPTRGYPTIEDGMRSMQERRIVGLAPCGRPFAPYITSIMPLLWLALFVYNSQNLSLCTKMCYYLMYQRWYALNLGRMLFRYVRNERNFNNTCVK